MAAQEDVGRERPTAKMTEEATETTEASVASEMTLEDLGLSTYVRNRLIDARLETAQDLLDRLDLLEKIEGIGGASMKEILERLADRGFRLEDEEALAERERPAPSETEKTKAGPERAQAEAGKAVEAEAENTEPSAAAPAERAAEQQVEFIVRLTVDEQSRTQLTHVEHRESSSRDNWPGLNIQRLAAFMEECISALVTPKPTPPPTRPPAEVEAPTPEPLEPAVSLTVSDVRVFRTAAPDVAALVLNPDEAFAVQAHFQLGPEALSLTAQESAFQVRVFAREVTTGTASPLATDEGRLAPGVLQYPARMQAPGLPPGLYHLLTLVMLPPPVALSGHYKGPVVRVTGVQPSVNPAASLQAVSVSAGP